MVEHILIAFASKKPFSDTPSLPNDISYDETRGYWTENDGALVQYDSFYGKQMSKKNDIETGEDQKGE